MRRALLALPLLLALGLPQPASAIDPPYEPQMERLAEILGSLYFLNPLCKPGGTDWREQLSELVKLDQPDEDRQSDVGAPRGEARLRRIDASVDGRCHGAAMGAVPGTSRAGRRRPARPRSTT